MLISTIADADECSEAEVVGVMIFDILRQEQITMPMTTQKQSTVEYQIQRKPRGRGGKVDSFFMSKIQTPIN